MKNANKHNANPKGKEIDLLVKRKVESLDFFPPPISGWNKKETWQIIKKQMEGADKTLIAWGFSIAASISLLVAAGLHIQLPFRFSDPAMPTKEIALKSTDYTQAELTVAKAPGSMYTTTNRPTIDRVKSKNIVQGKAYKQPAIKSVPRHVYNLDLQQESHTPSFNRKQLRLLPFISLSHATNMGTSPSVGLDYTIISHSKKDRIRSLTVGVNSRLQKVNHEQYTQTKLFTFVELGYSSQQKTSQKGWSAKAGLMVNPDSNVYSNNTVKFSLNRQFNQHIKAGPEIIFTNNFQKAYPGISLILS